MKPETTFAAILAAAFGALCSYASHLLVPLIMLFCVVMIDWLTGIAKAWVQHQMNSRIGLLGALKKLGFFVTVGVAGVVDWLFSFGLSEVGITTKLPFLIAAIVCVWLIINELISILENVAAIGGPVPPFIRKLLSRLKNVVEDKADIAAEGRDKPEEDLGTEEYTHDKGD